ncbi:MAG: PEP-CTERM sorting domain-containing protein [Cephaloticoccus sp.]|nr:PEP-CTERM sorting domain-containing protein [Cephaloticoccus sp.]MCF7758867.1 PEP-CTERM sorting domain-containing protein [Cephaloticoccus sp.]
MKTSLRLRWPGLWGAVFILLASSLSAQTAVVFATDASGNIGRYDVGLGAGTVLGSLTASGFSPGQVIGLAYDSVTNGVLIFDRTVNKVYSMDANTGTTTLLFSTPGVQLQGGAVFGGLIYGINENLQQLAAYSFAGVAQSLSGTALTAHVHSLGVNPITQQLFYLTGSSGVRIINTDGTEGTVLLTSGQVNSINSEDVAYYNGDYLVASYDRSIYLLDGTTGANTTFLTDAQLTTMGITGSVSGVTLIYQAVPEPGTGILLLLGGAVIVLLATRANKASRLNS